MGITPFFKTKKPTPYDEAVSLSWYLENVFYSSISNIFKYIKSNIFNNDFEYYDLVSLGFWPGGDRDGNPFVTTDITLKTSVMIEGRANVVTQFDMVTPRFTRSWFDMYRNLGARWGKWCFVHVEVAKDGGIC